MIAKTYILLPFKIWTIAGQTLSPILYHDGETKITVHPPARAQVDLTSGMSPSMWNRMIQRIYPAQDQSPLDGITHGSGKVIECDLLTIDFVRASFDRRLLGREELDPTQEQIFREANRFMAICRLITQASFPLLSVESSPWCINYLDDSQQELAKDPQLARGFCSSSFSITGPIVDIARWSVIGANIAVEPHHWESLLIQAGWYLPDIGPAIVAVQGVFESFIDWALKQLAAKSTIPNELWAWMNDRDGKFHQQPSLAERFDVLLKATAGKSLKDDPALWQEFMNLKKIRNAIAHGDRAMLGGKPVSPMDVRKLISKAQEIVRWVEQLLPEKARRFSLLKPSQFGLQIGGVTPLP